MSWSLGEARALAVKAARGAGMPWGLAEEAGFAVHRLQQHSLPGVRVLAEYLAFRSTPHFQSIPAWESAEKSNESRAFCPVEKGAVLQDLDARIEEDIGNVFFPLLLLPFLSADGALYFSGTSVDLFASTVTRMQSPEFLLKKQARCSWRQKTANDTKPVTRVPDSEKPYISWLTEFAANTYAPATEQSRLAGAGAGLNDNDFPQLLLAVVTAANKRTL